MSKYNNEFSRKHLTETIDSLRCSIEGDDACALLHQTWQSTVDHFRQYYKQKLVNELHAAITPEILAAYMKANPAVESDAYLKKATHVLGTYARGVVPYPEEEYNIWSMFESVLKGRLFP
jgi:hypothetical protein